ncbi:family S53 protease-like protein [Mycena metata]|uniref:tripeptidyl-peptidase II n=1 Tax=Mycena metata TaxID=1033252 RepID=A0AAD7NTB9_9AGAR|nr:family S53 protease-like protein [Mycena metata]
MGFKQLIQIISLLTVVSANSLVLHETRPAAPAGFTSQGAASADENVTLRVALKSNDVAGLQAKLMSISTPGSADFRQWLTADEVKSYMAPSTATVSAFTSFASANNLTHSVISPHGDWLSMTLPVSHANTLFAADFQKFTHESLTEPITRTLSVSLPSELVGHVDVLHPTTAFIMPNARFRTRAAASPARKFTMNTNSRIARGLAKRNDSSGVPASCTVDAFLIGPACIQDLYGIPTAPATASSTGKNTLLVTGYQNEFANTADLKSFLQQYRPDISSDTTFTLQTLDNGTNSQIPDDAGPEANLDVQYSIALATGIPVEFLSVGGGTTDADLFPEMLDTITYLQALETPPTVITTSYGDNEGNFGPTLAAKMCDGYMSISARGVSNLFASGDGGVRGGHDNHFQCSNNTFIPVFPGTCAYITSVGSTQDFTPQTVAPFSSGGFSNFFPVPQFQAAAAAAFIRGLPGDFAGIFNKSGRGFPDVSFAGTGFTIIEGNFTTGQSGTSASSPGFAAVVSLINDRQETSCPALLAAGKPVLGFLNPWLYSAGAQAGLTDITEGKNFGGACSPSVVAFNATKGWDPITGLGTPVFDKLLAAAMA